MGQVCLLIILYLAYNCEFSICEFVNLDKPHFSVNYGITAGLSSVGTGIATKIIVHCRATFSPVPLLDASVFLHMDAGSSSTPIINPISLAPCTSENQSQELCFSGSLAPSCALSYASFYCNVSLDRHTWHTSPRTQPDLCSLIERLVSSSARSPQQPSDSDSPTSLSPQLEAPRLARPSGLPDDVFFSSNLAPRTVRCLLAPVPLIATPRPASPHTPPLRLRVAIQLCKQLDVFRRHDDASLYNEEELDHLNLHCPERFNRNETYLIGNLEDASAAPAKPAADSTTAEPILVNVDGDERIRKSRASANGGSPEPGAGHSNTSTSFVLTAHTARDSESTATRYVSLAANFVVELDGDDAGYWLCRARVEVDCEPTRHRQLYSQYYWQWPRRRPTTSAPTNDLSGSGSNNSAANAAAAGASAAAAAAACGYDHVALFQHTVLSSSVLVYRSPPLHTRVLVGGCLLLVLAACVCVWTWRGARRCWRDHRTLFARCYRARVAFALTRLSLSSQRTTTAGAGAEAGAGAPDEAAHTANGAHQHEQLQLRRHLPTALHAAAGHVRQPDEGEAIEMEPLQRPFYNPHAHPHAASAAAALAHSRRYPC